MKNLIFKSQNNFDFNKFSLKLDIIQKEQRANRYDNQVILKKLDTCVKGLALLVSAPENDNTTLDDYRPVEGEDVGTDTDIPEGN